MQGYSKNPLLLIVTNFCHWLQREIESNQW